MTPEQSLAEERNLASEIAAAIESNLWRPSRVQLKAMINAGRWIEIGRMFGFKPVYITGIAGKKIIDWRCVPDSVSVILRDKAQMAMQERRPKTPHLRMTFKIVRARELKPLRQRLYDSQEGFCYYCREITEYAKFTVDHKTPRCRGGGSRPENVVGACKNCNNTKSHMTDAEFKNTNYRPGVVGRKGGKDPKQEVTRLAKLFKLNATMEV